MAPSAIAPESNVRELSYSGLRPGNRTGKLEGQGAVCVNSRTRSSRAGKQRHTSLVFPAEVASLCRPHACLRVARLSARIPHPPLFEGVGRPLD